jgi:hypothetical protein
MVRGYIDHLVIGLVFLVVVVAALLFYVTDGDALRKRRDDSKPEQSRLSYPADTER